MHPTFVPCFLLRRPLLAAAVNTNRSSLLRRHLFPKGSPFASGARCLSVAAVAALGVTELYSSEAAAEVASLAAASGFSKIPFSSIGLAHVYTSGWMQSLMETMHQNLDMPWWGLIVTSESNRTHTNVHLAPHFSSVSVFYV
jgi:hypothetical protein